MSTAPTIARNKQAASPEKAGRILGDAPEDKRIRLVFAFGSAVSDYLLTSALLEIAAAPPHLFKDTDSERA